MSTIISGKHIDVGDSLKQHAVSRVEEVCTRYLGEPADTHLTISKTHHFFIVDLDMHLGHYLNVHCRTQSADAYQAVDAAVNKMASRLKRYTARLHKRSRERLRDLESIPARQYIVESHPEDTAGDHPAVIAETTGSVNTLTVTEALMHMDLQDLPVLVFRNAGSKHLNVVYRRHDGHIGWIDPQEDKK